MKILFCGDVVGQIGRKVAFDCISALKEQLSLDAVIANVENAAHGFGLTPKIYHAFLEHGTDIMTMGNHTFDKQDVVPLLENEPYLIRPMNYPENTVGKGFCTKDISGIRLGVIQVLGRVFMKPVEDPFQTLNTFLSHHRQGRDYDILIVDVHAETTAEKMALAHFLDGRVSAVLGTHTHIPTADAHILKNGTAYMTDVGMCGDYDSVIGMQAENALARFLNNGVSTRLSPAEVQGTFCGVVIEISPQSGKAVKIFPVRIGAHLENTHEI